jgi:uncharacterized membrane protein YkoI
MKRTTKIAIGVGAMVSAVALLGGGLAQAASVDGSDAEETETPITGTALDQASAAALAYTGEGTVTGTEVGDEESYYEVEVTLDDGSEVDVQLDEAFGVVDTDPDGDTDD